MMKRLTTFVIGLLVFTTPAWASRHPSYQSYIDAAAKPIYQPIGAIHTIYRPYRRREAVHHHPRKERHARKTEKSKPRSRHDETSRGAPSVKSSPAKFLKLASFESFKLTVLDPLKSSLIGDGVAEPMPIIVLDRPYHFTGHLKIGDESFAFGTGGEGRGSIPYGDHQITPDAVGRWGARHGAIGIADDDIPDPLYPHHDRAGIELHAAYHSLQSDGCVALRNFATAKKAIFSMIHEFGRAFLHVWPGVYEITPNPRIDRAVIILATTRRRFASNELERHHRHRTRKHPRREHGRYYARI